MDRKKLTHWSPGGLFAACVVASWFIEASVAVAADWPHFGYDDQFTSYNRQEKTLNAQNVRYLEKKWGIGCDDGWFSVIFRSPAIYQNTLFTSSAGDCLRAYDARTGDLQWQHGDGNSGWAPQPVVCTDGTIAYMEGTIPTSLYGVRSADGKQLWKAPVGFDLGFEGAAYCVPTVDEARKTIYVVENLFIGDGKLFALSKQNGKVLWYMSKEKDKAAFRGNYVALKGAWVFATAVVPVSYSEADKIGRINSKTRKIEMYYDRPSPEEWYDIGGCTVCNDMLIVAYHDRDDVFRGKSILCAYNINSPKIVWSKRYTSSAVTGAVACNTTLKRIYVPTNPYLYAYDLKTGAEKWRYMGYDAIFSPSVANGVIYFLSDTNMYAIGESDKKKLFTFSLGYDAEYSTQVAVANGMVYFSGNGGDCDLYALGLRAVR
ncbi:MAG: PQQ-binding-like beta-propeller repeat protein [Acidobacteriota bacterium]